MPIKQFYKELFFFVNEHTCKILHMFKDLIFYD